MNIDQQTALRVGGVIFAVMIAFVLGSVIEDETLGLILTIAIGGIGGAFFVWAGDQTRPKP